MQTLGKKREGILFLYLSTGGGHIGAAKALAAECLKKNRNMDIHTLDILPPQNKMFRSIIEGGYRFSILYTPFFWQFIYLITKQVNILRFFTYFMVIASRAYLRRYIRKNNITRIVNLHSLITIPLNCVLQQLQRTDIPTMTIIVDPFSCHLSWFIDQPFSIITLSRDIYLQAQKFLPDFGTPQHHLKRKREIYIYPPVLNSKFNQAINPEDCLKLKEKYGFSRDKRLLLITGGGDGLPNGQNCLKAIAESRLNSEIAFVCGRNKGQYERISKTAKLFPNIRIKTYGFINFMYEMMNIADVILTKGGPATIFEALMLHKPIIITQFIYGQEQGNVDFVVKNELGWFITSPKKIVYKVKEIFEDPELINQVIKNIVNQNISIGNSQIIDSILSL